MSTRIPKATLAGPRLTLRPHRPADVAAIFAAVERSRAALTRWMPWSAWTRTPADTRNYVRHATAGRRNGTTCDFAIVERDTGEIVGNAGLNRIERDKIRSQANLGYWIRTDRTGRGYATEAAARILVFAFRRLGLARVEIRVATGNARSRRIPERLGVPFEGIARSAERVGGKFLDHRVYACTPADARRLAARWRRYAGPIA